MIPKKIHYCWLSGEDIPYNIKMCINTWKEIMPEYEIILWDKNRFDIKSVAFVEEACKVKKWAFAADYIRSYALYTEGGIYMDSDVLVKKKFDQFLEYDFFTSVVYYSLTIREKNTLDLLNEDGTSKIPFTHKPGFGIQAGVLGSIKGHPYLEDCLEYYSDKHFLLNNRSYFNKIVASDIYAMIAEKYGFKYKNELQRLNSNMLILPSEIFAGNLDEVSDNTYAIHYGAGSWISPTVRSVLRKILEKMKLDNAIRKLLRKPLKYKL
jgi:mannosyltransferase OCH1-like enzyme